MEIGVVLKLQFGHFLDRPTPSYSTEAAGVLETPVTRVADKRETKVLAVPGATDVIIDVMSVSGEKRVVFRYFFSE